MREAIDAVQRMTEGMEVRTHQAALDVRNVIKRYVAVLEERERDLLAHIEQFRQSKGESVKTNCTEIQVLMFCNVPT